MLAAVRWYILYNKNIAVDIAWLVLDCGFDINTCERQGWTPLHCVS